MNWPWAALMAAVGLMMAVGGATRASFIPYRWLHARAALLWKDNAHWFLLASGLAIIGLATLAGFGIIW